MLTYIGKMWHMRVILPLLKQSSSTLRWGHSHTEVVSCAQYASSHDELSTDVHWSSRCVVLRNRRVVMSQHGRVTNENNISLGRQMVDKVNYQVVNNRRSMRVGDTNMCWLGWCNNGMGSLTHMLSNCTDWVSTPGESDNERKQHFFMQSKREEWF